MTYFKRLFICLCFFYASKSVAQQSSMLDISLDTNQLHVFKDTIFDFAFDSLNCQMLDMSPKNTRLAKTFKYLGNDTVFIRRAWTNDPHFICKFPNEPLQKGKIYTFDVCFAFEGREGPFNKAMGFELSNDKVITMRFFGTMAKK